jgi:hypothetical protein
MPEVLTISTWVGGRGPAQPGLAEHRAQAPQRTQRSQKQVEDAIRDAIAKVPGTDASLGFDRPIYVAILGSDPDGLARVADEFAEKVRRSPARSTSKARSSPGCRPMPCA